VDDERAWLVLRDGGTRLRELGSLEPYPRALALYAELQIGEVAHAQELLGLGVPDLRLDLVAEAYEPFFARNHGLSAGELERLRALAPRFRALCAELAAYDFPPSIQHNDIHDTNVFVNDERVAIHDWGDSSVSHPLFSWLVPHRFAPRLGLEAEPLRDAYLEPWTAIRTRRELLEALEFAMPIASFAYALVFERYLKAMQPAARAEYRRYMPEHLRELLEWLTER
jgi:hypothetical protein